MECQYFYPPPPPMQNRVSVREECEIAKGVVIPFKIKHSKFNIALRALRTLKIRLFFY